MIPLAVVHHTKKGYQVVHRCKRCGIETRNVLVLDDPVQPDSFETVLEIMRRGPGEVRG
jgi:hypothetical protein